MSLHVEEAQLDDDAFLRDWSNLATAAENPFSTPEWYEAWLHSHQGATGLVLAVRAGMDLRGVVPLVVERRYGFRLVSGAASYLADFSGPACRAEDERDVGAAVVSYIARSWGPRDIWLLERCLANSAWEAAFADAWAGRQLCLRNWRSGNVLVQVPLTQESSPIRRGRDRREINRLFRKLQQGRDVTFRMSDELTAGDDVRALLDLRRARWTTKVDSTEDEFFIAMAQRAATARSLRLWTLEDEHHMIAGLLGWSLNGHSFAHLMAFDDRYARFGPGAVLLSEAVRSAVDAGDHTFDFLRGDEAHKRTYVTEHREVRSYLVARQNSMAGLVVLLAGFAQGIYRSLASFRRDRPRHTPSARAARTASHRAREWLQRRGPKDDNRTR